MLQNIIEKLAYYREQNIGLEEVGDETRDLEVVEELKEELAGEHEEELVVELGEEHKGELEDVCSPREAAPAPASAQAGPKHSLEDIDKDSHSTNSLQNSLA